MPADDIGHPIPDLTGYITEGQIVLSRDLDRRGVYPPVNVLPSLSRLMKDGTGGKYTDPDHPALVQPALCCVCPRGPGARARKRGRRGGPGPTPTERYLRFGVAFEQTLVNQSSARTLEQSMDVGWKLLERPALLRTDAPLRRADRANTCRQWPTRPQVGDRFMSDVTPTRSSVLEQKDERKSDARGLRLPRREVPAARRRDAARTRALHRVAACVLRSVGTCRCLAAGGGGPSWTRRTRNVFPCRPFRCAPRADAANVDGVKLQEAEFLAAATAAGTSAIDRSPEAEVCRRAFRDLLGPAAELAAVAGNLERLQQEYQRAVRRARALQDVLLPELDRNIGEIETRLEELEQEDAIWMRAGA